MTVYSSFGSMSFVPTTMETNFSNHFEMKRESSDGFDLNVDEASEPTELDIFSVR